MSEANNKSYKTHQKEVLLEYLKKNSGKHMTVSDICDYFKGKEKHIGITTIYRNLDCLVNSGLVNKYLIGPNEPAYFEYTEHNHEDDATILHCKCEKCGSLMHVECEELLTIAKHLKEHHNFSLSTKKTVVFGFCKNCLPKK